MPSPVPSAKAEAGSQIARWQKLEGDARGWFHAPDIEALEIVYTAAATQALGSTEPIWPMVIGPPSSGKTTLAVLPLLGLSGAHLLGDLSPRTLISCRKGKANSLLHRLNHGKGSGILLMKDFGTVLSKRESDRAEIMAQLREVYDGSYARDGGDGATPPWKGKVTIVAGVTLAIDRAWSFQHDLGERFTNIRWRSGDFRKHAERAQSQVGHEKEITETLRADVTDFIEGRITRLPPPLPAKLQERLFSLAWFVAQSRARVVRDSIGKREIIDVGAPEGAGRISKTLSVLVRFHAALFGRNEPDDRDLRIAQRVAVDAVGRTRWRFFSALRLSGSSSFADIYRAGIPKASVYWVGDELAALGIVNKESEVEVSYEFTPKFYQTLIQSGVVDVLKSDTPDKLEDRPLSKPVFYEHIRGKS